MAFEYLRSQGLGPSQILAAVLLALTLIALLFAFIFTALGGWAQDNDTFGSITQTVLVSGTGKVVLLLRRRKEGEMAGEDEQDEIERFLADVDDAGLSLGAGEENAEPEEEEAPNEEGE